MRRALVLVTVFVLVTLGTGMSAVGPAAATATIAAKPTTEVILDQLELDRTVDGFKVSVSKPEGEEQANLFISRGAQGAVYGTEDAKLEGKTLTARFGRLGYLHLTFQGPLHHGKRCGRRSETSSRMTGEFRFRGEGGYIDFDLHGMPANAEVLSGCGLGARPRPRDETEQEEIDREMAAIERQAREDEEIKEIPERLATLGASTTGPGPRVQFTAVGARGLHNSMEGTAAAVRLEHVGGLFIERFVLADIGPRRFDWDFAKGTATVRPPAPFSGSATFHRRPGGKSSWTGTLRARALGAPPLVLTGRDFKASLVPTVPTEERRRVRIGSGTLALTAKPAGG
jgi:hypothetical protein